MKTYKVYLRDYAFETINAENFAVDDQNNLVVGQNLFHTTDWKRIVFLYESGDVQVNHYDSEYGQVSPYYNEVAPTYAVTGAGTASGY